MNLNTPRIRANFDLCTGCDICRLECSLHKQGGYNPRQALLRLESKNQGLTVFPVVCHQCDNAYCLQVCPYGAIERDSTLGIPLIDKNRCRKCGLCISYCPLQVITTGDEGQAIKCDLCGGEPRCVEACPVGALTLVQEVNLNE